MSAKWTDNNRIPHNIIGRLDKMKSIHNDGTITFSDGLEFYDYRTALFSAIVLSNDIPDVVKSEMISKSISETAKSGTLKADKLLKEISKQESAYSKKPLTDFVLITNMSIKPLVTLRNIMVNGCRIKFSGFLPKKLNSARKNFLKYNKNHVFGDMPSFYTVITITARGRSDLEAGECALNAINTIRSIWNLYYNRGIGTGISSGRREPVNKIVLGPLHSLHLKSGEFERFWYETKYVRPLATKDISSDLPNLRQFEKKVRRITLSSSATIKEKIMKGLLWYVSALDEWDHESAFLKLWSLLEFLTDTTEDRYDVTIRRMASICKDTDFHKEILEHLRKCRNGTIHLNQSPEYAYTLMFQIKRYVETLLIFYLFDGGHFNDTEEIKEYLSLSSNKDSLKTRVRLSNLKLKTIK